MKNSTFFNVESWARTTPYLLELPAGAAMCERVRNGSGPRPAIGAAMGFCTSFPTKEFIALLASRDFDVRWPLTFAAWYLGSCGASVDEMCADFLSEAYLWDQALQVLPEYAGREWLDKWRVRFGQLRPARPGR
jgi:hypothetical protein